MFGIPLEVIVTLVSSVASWWMKKKAQDAADLAAERKAWIAKSKRIDDSQDRAARRSNPWLRKFVAVTVISVSFVGIFVIAFFPDIPVSIIEEVPRNSFLWGLIEWGSTFEVITADGFVLPEWVRFSVCTIVGFLFGSGFAKTR